MNILADRWHQERLSQLAWLMLISLHPPESFVSGHTINRAAMRSNIGTHGS
jgi:hypothetical protein